MVKIWAKTYTNDKITRDILYTIEGKYDPDNFFTYITEICHEFDIPSPLILKAHIENFTKFNITRFKAADFVEIVYFDNLTLEFCS